MRDVMKDVQRKVAASPSAEDFAKEAGASIRYEANGEWVATVRGEENMRRAVEMQEGVRRVDVEMGDKVRARKQTETVIDSAGRVVAFPAEIVERVADKRGWKPKRYYGRAKARWVARNGELVRVF